MCKFYLLFLFIHIEKLNETYYNERDFRVGCNSLSAVNPASSERIMIWCNSIGDSKGWMKEVWKEISFHNEPLEIIRAFFMLGG